MTFFRPFRRDKCCQKRRPIQKTEPQSVRLTIASHKSTIVAERREPNAADFGSGKMS